VSGGFGLREYFSIGFGLFLGLALLKFGNPIILNSKIPAPTSLYDWWEFAWPPKWSLWFLIPFVALGVMLFVARKPRWPGNRWLWIFPCLWFGWQLVSATQTEDAALTSLTVLHFAGMLGCYFIGAFLIGDLRLLRFALIGILLAYAICSARAVTQRLYEFPEERRMLVEGERSGWTNVAPELLIELKLQNIVVTTNGVDVANPVILQKYERGRVFGTLVYPNALAGAILLLFPAALVFAFGETQRFRTLTRWAAIGLTMFLGAGALFWTGSKSGWLIALVMVGLCLFRLKWSTRLKWIVLIAVFIIGSAGFAVRFQSYFAKGATSLGARFDYWRAAAQITADHPILGSGPGTFQHPYERIKAPESEMARLVHNDYLEQFSDSGIVAGVCFLGWVVALTIYLARTFWRQNAVPLLFALWLGLTGWLLQGVSEFGLYVPALSWTAFFLGGALLSLAGNQIDKPDAAH
jgi:Lipid A core - O-antigen ligase and related enzymes